MNAEPQAQHRWLQRLVGEWRYEGEAACEPGAAPSKFTGTETVRSLGGLWVLCEGQGIMPDGSPATTVMTLGFDPQRGHFAGTWIGSMMTWLWVYRGSLDEGERILTLETEGPSMAAEGTLMPYRDVIEMVSDDHRVLTSHTQDADGKWNGFMTAHYHRAN